MSLGWKSYKNNHNPMPNTGGKKINYLVKMVYYSATVCLEHLCENVCYLHISVTSTQISHGFCKWFQVDDAKYADQTEYWGIPEVIEYRG